MKRIVILTLSFCIFALTGIYAQVNENVTKETTVKKATIKDTNVETIVNQEVDEKKSVIKVEGTDKTNQESKEEVISDEVSKSVSVEAKTVNTENEKDLKKLKEEEYKRIDGQQRGVPLPLDGQPQPKLKTKSKKDGRGK